MYYTLRSINKAVTLYDISLVLGELSTCFKQERWPANLYTQNLSIYFFCFKINPLSISRLLKMNTLYQRYTLHLRTQTSNETVEEYASEIRRLAESCEFGIEKESRIRDYVLFGLNNRQISLSIIKRGGDPKLNEIFGWFLPLECQINVNVIPSVQPKIESNQNFGKF